jgi:hypothetical protein
MQIVGRRVKFEYATALFDASTVARVADSYMTLLGAVAAAEPATPIQHLGMLSEAQRKELALFSCGPWRPDYLVGGAGRHTYTLLLCVLP